MESYSCRNSRGVLWRQHDDTAASRGDAARGGHGLRRGRQCNDGEGLLATGERRGSATEVLIVDECVTANGDAFAMEVLLLWALRRAA
jgi:hypothetical protein